MDETTLAQMAYDIAAVLRKHLPQGDAATLHSETTRLKSKSCAQVFAFVPGQGGVFSVNAELRHPPSRPGKLSLKCVAGK